MLGLHLLRGLVGVGHLLGIVQALPRQGVAALAGRPEVQGWDSGIRVSKKS